MISHKVNEKMFLHRGWLTHNKVDDSIKWLAITSPISLVQCIILCGMNTKKSRRHSISKALEYRKLEQTISLSLHDLESFFCQADKINSKSHEWMAEKRIASAGNCLLFVNFSRLLNRLKCISLQQILNFALAFHCDGWYDRS